MHTTDWTLSKDKIISPQQASIEHAVEMAKHGHHIDIVIRINGRDETLQADWIKHLEPGVANPEGYGCPSCGRKY